MLKIVYVLREYFVKILLIVSYYYFHDVSLHFFSHYDGLAQSAKFVVYLL